MVDSRWAMASVVRPAMVALDGRLDESLADGVEGARRLVEDEDAGVLEQHPGERDALLLAARQLVAALADDRVVAVGQLHDPVVDGGRPRGGVQLARRSRRAARTAGSSRTVLWNR